MRILVTGGAGYVGSVAVNALLNRGHKVLVYDDLSTGHREAVDPRVWFVRGNLCEGILHDAMWGFKPEAVMHFAASALVGESMEFPLKYFRNNFGNGLKLLEAMESVGCKRLVFSSSCAIFGNLVQGLRMGEDHPQCPTNPYGESKLAFEKVLKWQSACKGLQVTNLRYFNAAGAVGNFGEDHKMETHLIPNVLKVALGQKPYVEVYGTKRGTPDGSCIRDFISVSDLAEAHVAVLENGIIGSYNLGSGLGHSVLEVVGMAREVTGKDIPVMEKWDRPGDPDILVAYPMKAKMDFGWVTKVDLRGIVASAWDWHREHPDGYVGGPK